MRGSFTENELSFGTHLGWYIGCYSYSSQASKPEPTIQTLLLAWAFEHEQPCRSLVDKEGRTIVSAILVSTKQELLH